MYPKPIIIAVCCTVAIVVGVYLFGHYTLEKNRPDDIPTTSQEKPTAPVVEQKQPPTAKKHSHRDVEDLKLADFPATLDEFEALSDAEIEVFGRIFRSLPQEKQDEISRRMWGSKGLTPPPNGHAYYKIDGITRLIKYDDPMFKVTWVNQYGNLHQLIDEEWEEYKVLIEMTEETLPPSCGFTKEMVPIAKEWKDKLWKKTWGPHPNLFATIISQEVPTEAVYERRNKVITDKYESLIPPIRSGTIDYTVVTRLVNQLKEELERRNK